MIFEVKYKAFYRNGKLAYESIADNNFEMMNRTDYDLLEIYQVNR